MKKKLNEKEVAKTYLQILKENEETQKQLISNHDYISWLEKFTQTHPSFCDDSWLYKKEELSQEDYVNVTKLDLFFNAISNYCDSFHINIACCVNFERRRVHIKHNNIGYVLGLVVGQGAFVYVNREAPQDDAICFANIINNIGPEEFKSKEELLQEFEKILSAMKEANLPSEVVENIMKKYY